MTTQQLKDKLHSITPSGYGHWKVIFNIYGKPVRCTTTNSQAVDRINHRDECRDRRREGHYTYKEALLTLYNQCRANCTTGKNVICF